MADVNNTDVRTATNASNTTRYFHLPLFIASDKPSWLVDWNGAMGDIDNILQEIATASEGAVADVATIQSQIDALNATIPNLESLVETAVSDVAAMQTTVDSHETRMDAIEADLITQNNLIKTLSDAVTTMQGTVATLTNRVAAMETTVSGYDTEINAIQTGLDSVQASLTSLQSTVSGHTSSINSLNTRVTALENAGGGSGLPSVTDLNDATKYTHTREEKYAPSDQAGSVSYQFDIPANAYYTVRAYAKNTTSDTTIEGFAHCAIPLGFGAEVSAVITRSISGAHGNTSNSGLLKNGDSATSITGYAEMNVASSASAIAGVVVETWTKI